MGTPEAVQAPAPAPAMPGPADIQPTAHETLDRTLTGLVTALPMIALGVAAWLSWEGLLNPTDLIVFGILYVLTGLGVTVGFHRLFTHRSFKTGPVVRGALGIMGSASIEGPVISWVADHRKHHAFADLPGDPHSPHVDHGVGLRGSLRGLLHAHVGWLFRPRPARLARALRARPARRSRDAVRRPLVPGVGDRRSRGRVRPRLRDRRKRSRRRSPPCCGAAASGCSCCTTSRTASTRSATSSAAAGSTPPTSRATCSGCRCCRSASRGTTTTTRSRRRHDTGCGRGSPTRRRLAIRGLAACGLAWDVVDISPERQARKLRK